MTFRVVCLHANFNESMQHVIIMSQASYKNKTTLNTALLKDNRAGILKIRLHNQVIK